MSMAPRARGITGSSQQLSTGPRLLSTRRVESLQLRDVEFVSSVAPGTYRGTGADSRVPLACPPLRLVRGAAFMADLAASFLAVCRDALLRPSHSRSGVSITS